MSLTTDDLQAITKIIDERLMPEFATLNYKIDTIYDELTERTDKLQCAVDDLTIAVNHIERAQKAEIGRADRHDIAIGRLNRKLGLV